MLLFFCVYNFLDKSKSRVVSGNQWNALVLLEKSLHLTSMIDKYLVQNKEIQIVCFTDEAQNYN